VSETGKKAIDAGGLLRRLGALIGSKQSLRRQLMLGVTGTGGVKVAAMCLALLSSTLLARLLGAEGYGIYGFAMAVISLLAIPMQLGLPQFIVRQCAVYIHRGDLGLMIGLLRRANQIVLSVAMLLATVAALVVHCWIPQAGAASPEVLIWAFALLPLIGLSSIRSAALRGMGRVVLGQLPEELVRPLLFITLVGVVAISGWQLKPLQAIRLQFIATLGAFVVGTWLLYRYRPNGLGRRHPRFETRSWLSGVLPFLVLSGAAVLMQQTDVIMLGVLATAKDVGIYRIASQVGLLAAFGIPIISTVIAPQIARLNDAGDHQDVQRVITSSTRILFVFTVIVVMLFILAGQQLLVLIFGKEFGLGYRSLLILACSYLVVGSIGFVGVLLEMTDNAWFSVIGVTLSGIINVGLNLFLIPRYGIEGAAVATGIALVVRSVFLFFWAYRLTGIVSSVLIFKRGRVT